MKYIATDFDGLFVLEPTVWNDDRGYFFESYGKRYERDNQLNFDWVQDNEAYSTKGILRGLHYQTGHFCQAKLVRVVLGEVQDVVIDLRAASSTYGQSYSINLSGDNKKQLLVPRGFAHGYLVLSDTAIFTYKCDNGYHKASEGGLFYGDSALGIDWQLPLDQLIVSEKDAILPVLGQHIEVDV